MRALAAVLVFAPLVVLADIGVQNAGKSLGPVQFLDCVVDGGLWCSRDAGTGTSVAKLSCALATASTPGCMSTLAQSIAGTKTFSGTVITPIIDAGVGAIGTLDLRGNTLTGLGTASTLTIQSNTADSTTSSTVGAITLRCGSSINFADACLDIQNVGGSHLARVTSNGSLNFSSHMTDTGAPTVSGTDFNSFLGNGGVASTNPGGNGGGYSLFTGQGGASDGVGVGGPGGSANIQLGAGGASNGAQKGGTGGALSLTSGLSGNGSPGGSMQFTAGAGGSGSASWPAGAGGFVTFTSGPGGDELSGGAAANGGAVSITAARGGGAVSGTAGTGGAMTLQSGSGGAANAGTGAPGGTVTLDTGAATGAATAATMSIGATNAGTITLGRSGKSLVVNSYGVLTTHGSTVLAAESGASAMTASELAVTFATAFGAAPACTCTHVNTTNTNACNIKSGSAPTTTAVTFAVASGGTDAVDWICVGQR